jgi:hypothetical protein
MLNSEFVRYLYVSKEIYLQTKIVKTNEKFMEIIF